MSQKGAGKALTAELVFTKTKSDSLHNIKNLNLWGNDLEDLQLIEKMPNLEVVSLSVNRIYTLKDFAKCHKLQQLYLRKNNITDIREIKHLTKLPGLKVLWLHDNPCAQVENYRELVIRHLPNLVKLDNHQITHEERVNSQKVNVNLGAGVEQAYEQQKWKKPHQNQSYMSNKAVEYDEKPVTEEKWNKKPPTKKHSYTPEKQVKEEQITRNQNILMAVLSLMRELDPASLEIIKRQADNLMQ